MVIGGGELLPPVRFLSILLEKTNETRNVENERRAGG